MKIVSRLLLVVFAVATLVSCGEQGQGPAKPKYANSIDIPQK